MHHPLQLRFFLVTSCLFSMSAQSLSLFCELALMQRCLYTIWKNLMCLLLRKQFSLSMSKHISSLLIQGKCLTTILILQGQHISMQTWCLSLCWVQVQWLQRLLCERGWGCPELDPTNSSSSSCPTTGHAWACQPRWYCL